MINLKEIRIKSGLNQKELAKKLGIANCTLAHYESGLRSITLDMFLKILEICHCKLIVIDEKETYQK